MGPHEDNWAGGRSVAWQPRAWIDWLPVGSLILGADGAAVAVNSAWAAMCQMSEQDSLGIGWLDAIVPAEREAFGTRVRRAAASGEPGRAACRLAAPAGIRRSRWWWQPAPVGGLVCVTVIDDSQAGTGPGAVMDVDLASVVVHRIFGIGLALESVAGLAGSPAAARLERVIGDLDDLIRDIRAKVFQARRISCEE